MIYLAASFIIITASLYVLSGKWLSLYGRLLFGMFALLVSFILFLFGLDLKVRIPVSGAERRVVGVCADISASTGLSYEEVRSAVEKEFPAYNISLYPFSSEPFGPAGASSSAIVESTGRFRDYMAEEYEDNKVAGLVIISDGNETERLPELIKSPGIGRGYPHNVIYIGSGASFANFDRSVSWIEVPRFISRYSGEKVKFSVSVSGGRSGEIPVELRLNGKNIGTVLTRLENGYGVGEYEINIRDAGNSLLEAAIAADSREKDLSNNTAYAAIEGIIRGFRVLHISGRPSTDTAFVRRGLQNIPGVDLISFFILRTQNQVSTATESELSLIPFPTEQLFKSELDNFDLIISNDFRFSAYLPPDYIENIVRFVKSGGGLLILGGENSFTGNDFFMNSFREIIPVVPEQGANWDANASYAIRSTELLNYTTLKALAPLSGLRLSGLNRVAVSPGADVFFTTEQGRPLAAGRAAGKGRVLVFFTDSLWKAVYEKGMRNETMIKSMARYLLNIPSMPVKSAGGSITFERGASGAAGSAVSAVLSFIDGKGQSTARRVLRPGESYTPAGNESRIIQVEIKKGSSVVDSYRLVNVFEKSENEFKQIAAGRDYLKRFASEGNGAFIESPREGLAAALGRAELRRPLSLEDTAIEQEPLYRYAPLVLMLLFSAVAAFYLKSRYSG